MGWLVRLVRRDRLERELDAELAHHVSEEAHGLEADGLQPEEARRQALARFGGLEPIKEQARDARGTRWVEDLSRDVRYAFRMMRRSPMFTAAAIISLAVGIGANAAIFSISDALLLRPLDVARPNELWFLNRAGFAQPNYRFSYPGLTRLQKAMPDVQFAASASNSRIQIDRDGGAELAFGQLVTGNWFDVLGVGASAGRVLNANDASSPGASAVAVLSHAFWTREYGADPRAVGSTVRVNGLPLTIVGVAARNFMGVSVGTRVDLWAPVTMQQELRSRGNASIDDADGSKPWVTQDGVAWLTVVGRVPASVSPTESGARIAGFWKGEVEESARQIQDTARRNFRLREHVELVPGARGLSTLRDSFSQPLVVLMVTVAAVLLIACANLASLLLARSTARGREFALRLSLGAGRSRVVRQLLAESLTLSVIGGLAGLGVAQVGGHGLLVMASPGPLTIPLDLPLDWRLIAFTVTVSIVTGVLFGLGPALRSARPNLVDPLKGGSRVVGGERRAGGLTFGKILIALQVALSFALLVGALLFLRTFQNLLDVDTGFDRSEVVVAMIDPILSGVTVGQLPDLYARLVERGRAIPGATSAALALSGPVSGSARTSSIAVDAEPMRIGRDADVREDYVTPEYFRTVGMSILRGRSFIDDDAMTPSIMRSCSFSSDRCSVPPAPRPPRAVEDSHEAAMMNMHVPSHWVHVLAAEVAMAPRFLAELDRQLRSHAQSLVGVDRIGERDYTLLPHDTGFAVQFRATDDGVIGLIEGDLVDPSAFGHPVVLGWRARRAADQPVQPDQDRDDLEFFWIEFPVAELSASTRVDTGAAAAAVTVPFPVEWDVHQWEGGVWLVVYAHGAFADDELDALNAAVQHAVRDWNAREPSAVDYLAAPQSDRERAWAGWYLDPGVAGADVIVAVINVLGATPAAGAIARCSVGRRH